MIAQFTVQPEALALSHLDPALRLSHTELVIRFWQEHGVLLVPDTFLEAVGCLPQNQRKRWQAAVRSLSVRRQFFGPVPSLVRQVQLSLVTRDWILGKTLDDCVSITDEELGCEACRIDCLGMSEVVKKLWGSRAGEIPEHTSCDDIWNRCFLRPVQHAGTITIMDRYAGRSLAKCRSERRSGLNSLLDRLPKKKVHCHLRLYTGFDDSGTDGDSYSAVVAGIRAAVEHLLPTGYTFTLYLAEDPPFGERYHYRYFRFDQSWNLKTDAGLAILEGPDLYRRAIYNFDPISDEHLQAENRFTAEHSTKAFEYRQPEARAA